jgi:hypothetical protein
MLSMMRLAFFLCLSLCAQPKPCSSPAHHAADFLLGDWEVRDGKDRLMGWSRFESHAEGCAIIEHWRGIRGGEGTGLFYYDAGAKLWIRKYVGPGFIERDAKATLEGGALAFTAHADKAQMKFRYDKDARGPFLLDQESMDGGKTWSQPERRSMHPLTAPKNYEPKPEIAPQCSEPEFRQFDFWLGSWSVTNKGKNAGSNRILAHSKGCVLLEFWKPAQGPTGVSMNFFDPLDKQWKQFWVSPGGNLNLSGAYSEGAMTLTQTGNRIVWRAQSDGTVTQDWDTSSDKGKTWKPAFHGVYQRQN